MTTFSEALGMSESGGNYGTVNSLGYSGKYQWGQARLNDFNKAMGTNYSMDEFLSSPKLQEEGQAWHEADIMGYVFDTGLDKYIGSRINGIEMNPESMKAMAHLGGKAGMRKFVESGGKYNPEDAYGTSLMDYAAKFAGDQAYETNDRLRGGTPLSFGTEVESATTEAPEAEGPSRMDTLMTAYEMMMEGSPEYCPAGHIYDTLTKSCIPIDTVSSSPRPKAAPERGAALQRFGLPSLA